jgi:hypothetical protein
MLVYFEKWMGQQASQKKNGTVAESENINNTNLIDSY